MPNVRFPSFLLLAAGALLATATALAQDDAQAFAGTWRLAMGTDAARQRIERAIETATDDMGPLREAIGSNRLEDRNPVLESVQIDLRESTIWIRYGDHAFDLPRGRFGSVDIPDGDTARARARIRGGRLLVDWRMEDGNRFDVFALNGDRLSLTIRITSEQLPEDMQYRLPFRRAE